MTPAWPHNCRFCIIALLLLTFFARPAAAARAPLIHGQAQMPFPAIAKIDYLYCRAQAWLLALENARQHLPASANQRLRQTGFASELAQLALAALACPIDVVTPERAVKEKLRVFLHMPQQMAQIQEALSQRPWLLAEEMAIVQETITAVTNTGQNWPASVAQAQREMPGLDKAASLLAGLWLATPLVRQTLLGQTPAWGATVAGLPESCPILLEIAREREDLELADRAVALALTAQAGQANREEGRLWNYLLADALYLRGLAHEKIHQNALAETDFNAAIARLANDDPQNKLLIHLALARAELRRKQKNIAGMCADYARACSLGNCRELAAARRAGLCETPS